MKLMCYDAGDEEGPPQASTSFKLACHIELRASISKENSTKEVTRWTCQSTSISQDVELVHSERKSTISSIYKGGFGEEMAAKICQSGPQGLPVQTEPLNLCNRFGSMGRFVCSRLHFQGFDILSVLCYGTCCNM